MVLLIVALLAIVAALWSRMAKIDATVRQLTGRIARLERVGDDLSTAGAAEPPPPQASAAAAPPLNVSTHVAVSAATLPTEQPLAPPPPKMPATVAASPNRRVASLEQEIGGRWLLYAAILAIVVGAAYFEKLAMDNHWIGETARVIQGAVAGLALIIGGGMFTRRGYAFYGQIVIGGGIAILYLSIYAAFNLYGLIGHTAAFALMIATTAAAGWLADRHRSPGLAFVAVCGGFATPFLLPSGIDAYVALFVFDAILIAGSTMLARRRGWPWLHAVSYVGTAMSMFVWAANFFEPSKYFWTEVFLTLFCGVFLYLRRELRQRPATMSPRLDAVLWTALPAYYVGSLAVLAGHAIPQLIFLSGLGVAGAAVAARAGSVVRLAFWMAVAVPLLAWAGDHAGEAVLLAGGAAIVAQYATFLLAQLAAMRRVDSRLDEAGVVLVHANPLGAYAAAYLLLDPTAHRATGWIAAAFAVWHGVVATMVAQRWRDYALHSTAVGFTLLTAAVAILFNGVWVTAAWAAEGAAVIALGLREGRNWLRIAGAWLFLVAIARLVDLLFSPPPLNHATLFNRRAAAAMFIIALVYALAWAHRRAGPSRTRTTEIAAAVVAAQALTLALLTSEILAYWTVNGSGREGLLARGVTLSIGWALYATVLIVVGIARRYAPLRYVAFALFAGTIWKVFAVDLSQLDRIYRVSSVISLGIALLFASYLYQRFRVDASPDQVQ
jgi:uncharacterized membrane protein